MSHRLPLQDIQFIAEFAAFCRTKGDERYSFGDNFNCALSQFVKATGRAKEPCCSAIGWWDMTLGPESRQTLPAGLDNGRGEGALPVWPFTFSALADRLELLIADAPNLRSA